ncbi:MAG: PIG-L family deacetylase [Bacteroidetes bacterium]|nr:PIG-L family deacetylase [Bacteroidota bacterium]
MKFSGNKLYILLAAFGFIISNIISADAQELNSGEIYKEIQKLNQFGSVLYIAAHPDDENTRLISYLSKGKLYRVGYLSLTRGDGGQNLIGPEQGIELGLIRTNELLQARSVDGAEQFFTRAYDFGYSKNPEETFSFWNKDSVLRDVVWVIRKFKPDVIITRFPDTGEGGHGHHTASAILAKEAFKAAADPNRFPEQLKEVTVWQAKKLFWNTFNFGTNNTISEDQFKLDVGTYDPILGVSYGEIASQSRSKHSSQGFGTPLVRKPIYEYFVTWEGTEPKSSFLEGIDTGWDRAINNPSRAKLITQKVNEILTKFDFTAPYKSITALYTLRSEVEKNYEFTSPTLFWLNKKIEAINKIISQCAGVYCEITSNKQNLVPGQTAEITFSVISRMPNIQSFECHFKFENINIKKDIKGNYWDTTFTYTIPTSLNFETSQPYWLRKPRNKGLFADVDLNLLGLAKNPSPFKAEVSLNFNTPDFYITQNPTLNYKYNDPSKGEITQPVFITPPVVIIPETDRTFFQLSEVNNRTIEKTVNVKVKCYAETFKGNLIVEVPEEWQLLNTPDELKLDFSSAGSEKNIEIKLRLFENPSLIQQKGSYNAVISYYALSQGQQLDISEKRLSYPHIPNLILYSKAKTELVLSPISVETAGKIGRIGYITGAGDKVMESLKEIGIDIYELSESDLSNPSILGMYKTIITGVRAFNVHSELKTQMPNLMSFVNNGGRLLVQYNTNNRLAPLDFNIGPYPLTITNKRITDETAIVTFLHPNDKLLQEPFKITPSDFNNWVQERGIYFAGDRDPNYVSLFSMADPKEASNDGSLVYANYGKGGYIYTGLVFFRELPAGNIGAYKIFINLIYNP